MASNVTTVNIRNAEDTLAALKNFDTDASKAVAKGLRSALRPIVRAAQQAVPQEPLSQWARYGWIERRQSRSGTRERDLRWDANKVRRGIQVVLGGRRQRGRIVSNLAGIRSGNAAGAIYELAGARTPGNPIDRSLQQEGYGGPKRLVLAQDTPANRHKVEAAVTAAMREAEQVLQRRLDRMV